MTVWLPDVADRAHPVIDLIANAAMEQAAGHGTQAVVTAATVTLPTSAPPVGATEGTGE